MIRLSIIIPITLAGNTIYHSTVHIVLVDRPIHQQSDLFSNTSSSFKNHGMNNLFLNRVDITYTDYNPYHVAGEMATIDGVK
jgi:hypothetical protein